MEEQKARRCRIAFESLRDYFKKATRNSYVITTPQIESRVVRALDCLRESSLEVQQLDKQISMLLSSNSEVSDDNGFREVIRCLLTDYPDNFDIARREIGMAMELAANQLSSQWNSDRYVRGEIDLD